MNKIVVTTSLELSKAKKAEIIQKIENKYGQKEVCFNIDDKIIGGIILFDGEKVYDGSIKSQLNKFKEKIKK